MTWGLKILKICSSFANLSQYDRSIARSLFIEILLERSGCLLFFVTKDEDVSLAILSEITFRIGNLFGFCPNKKHCKRYLKNSSSRFSNALVTSLQTTLIFQDISRDTRVNNYFTKRQGHWWLGKIIFLVFVFCSIGLFRFCFLCGSSFVWDTWRTNCISQICLFSVFLTQASLIQ